ncbi:hypothetical protein EST38_g3623 [Candolleomyces aberdarensis]|uniref:Protein kinase domain-containing protein n=1 Tax=Candolleomyces aberdarensis TaxID=2316362 RepID=A0A4Q2DTP0_9AGAR|nr:hypothetical protein EST38_g3623 [Candolleomyces aberdarensis]
MSPVPLALTSKKSVRDLKRQASLQSKGGLSRNGSLKSNASRSGSLKGSGWSNVSRNSSFRKLKARLKGMKPVGVGKEVLNEHDSVGLDVVGGKTYVDELGLVRPLTPSSLTPEWLKVHNRQGSSGSLDVNWVPPSLSRNNSTKLKSRTASTGSVSSSSSSSRLVAVKLTPRRPVPYSPQAQERTRVGFVREVEILRHISHPNITPLFSFFSTPTYHVLVLPYLRGGDLLSLVNDDKAWNGLSEGVLRRIWCEICRGVGWMHSVGLVHRDVKLENVLITWDGLKGLQQQQESMEAQRDDEKSSIAEVPLCCSPESVGSIHDHHQQRKSYHRRAQGNGIITVDDLPTPLIKLTDFGLSRFIDIGNGERGQGELLTTRCGSEAYAAPELVMGTSSYSYAVPASSSTQGQSTATLSAPPRKGVYDARETDAWACGVVLYALVARQLPFGEGVGADGVVGAGRASRIGGERAFAGIGGGKKVVAERRQWLMRIAKGDWEWPPVTPEVEVEEGEELVGPRLVRCEGAKGIVSRLLVRDHRKRARIQDLWEDEWMRGDAVGRAVHEGRLELKKEVTFEGELRPGAGGSFFGYGAGGEEDEGLVGLGEGDWEPLTGEEDIGDEEDDDMDEIDEEEEDGEDEGWLLDEEGIASIARQEVV